jgi:hypothetical protein
MSDLVALQYKYKRACDQHGVRSHEAIKAQVALEQAVLDELKVCKPKSKPHVRVQAVTERRV